MRISEISMLLAVVTGLLVPVSAALAQSHTSAGQETAVSFSDVMENYADIGLASYQDSLNAAEEMRTAIEHLLNNPDEEALEQAREAWRTARIPYEQSEVFAQGNPVVMEWVDRVNAWPIDESFIDYTAAGDTGPNIVNSTSLLVDGVQVDISELTPEVITQALQHANGQARSIASGYHVIEFLLWGEDTSGPEEKGVEEGAGQRPASDFDLENCTNDNCDRRGEYLYSVVNLLIEDLQEMVGKWGVTGEARRALLADSDRGMSMMLSGLGSLTLGELAGNRLMASLRSGQPDSEQDRFSNNTHISYLFNARGVVGVYFGEYYSMDAKLTSGASLADLVKAADPALDEEFRSRLGVTLARMRQMVDHARDKEAYDLMIAPGNEQGNALISSAVDALQDQAETLRRIADLLELEGVEFSSSPALADDR